MQIENFEHSEAIVSFSRNGKRMVSAVGNNQFYPSQNSDKSIFFGMLRPDF